MVEIKHTPGPWEYIPSTQFLGPYVTSAFGSTICDCYIMSGPSELTKPHHYLYEMADPNACLIAAAPELLEALQKAMHLLAWDDPEVTQDGAAQARAAIAKALWEKTSEEF